jgi:outer membrane protein TolC
MAALCFAAAFGAPSQEANGVHLIDLATALQLAGARNLDIQIAREKFAEARAQNQSATWQFFPWISPGFTYRRHDNLVQNVEGRLLDVRKQSYSVGPTINAQLDLGDAIYRKLAARQLVQAADFALAGQRQDTILAAAQGYFDLAKAQAAVGVAQEALNISTNYHEQVRQAVAAGLAFKGDALRVQVQTDRNQLAVRQAQEQQRVAAARLATTLHLDAAVELVARDSEIVPLFLIPTNATLDALVVQALDTRPELKQSRALRDAARAARIGARYGPLIPSLGAQVFVGGLGGDSAGAPARFGESEDYQFTLGWRLGPGGLFDRGRVQAAESRLKIAGLNDAKVLDEINRQVIEAFTRFQSLSDQLTAARRAVEAATQTLRLTQQRREFGVGAVLETIVAEQELTRARLDYLTTAAEFNKAQYSLSKATGSLSAPPAPAERQEK